MYIEIDMTSIYLFIILLNRLPQKSDLCADHSSFPLNIQNLQFWYFCIAYIGKSKINLVENVTSSGD